MEDKKETRTAAETRGETNMDNTRKDNMREDELIREALDRLSPSEELKADMWSRIEASAQSADRKAVRSSTSGRSDMWKKTAAGNGQTGSKNRRFVQRIIAVAAALVLIVGGVTWFSGRGGSGTVPVLAGNVYAMESRVTDMTAEEILVSVGDPDAAGDIYVYAPKIYYLDDQRLVFGNATGLIIYDLTNDKVAGLIDMQAICSGYYNSDTIRTHVLVEGDELTVYNTQGQSDNLAFSGDASDDVGAAVPVDEPFGFYHKFDLSLMKGDGSLLEPAGSGDNKDVISELIERGSAFESETYVDAWDNIGFLQSDEMDELIGRDNNTYSELAYVRETAADGKTENILISRGDGYELLTELETGDIPVRQLDLGITDSVRQSVKALTSLPAYEYTGDDAAVGAICNALAADEENWYGREEDGGVNIPAPVIYGKEQNVDELLVFGNFWVERYIRQGNTLVCTSGGEMPACYHLKETADGYEIVSVDVAGDGEDYAESIKEFTKDYPAITDKFFGDNSNDAERIDAIRAYVDAHDIGIKYVKDYGWDPIEL